MDIFIWFFSVVYLSILKHVSGALSPQVKDIAGEHPSQCKLQPLAPVLYVIQVPVACVHIICYERPIASFMANCAICRQNFVRLNLVNSAMSA